MQPFAHFYITLPAAVVGCGYVTKQTVHYAINGLEKCGFKFDSRNEERHKKLKKTIEKIGCVIGVIIGVWAAVHTAVFAAVGSFLNNYFMNHAEKCFLEWGVIEEKITDIGRQLILCENIPLPITREQLIRFGIPVAARVLEINAIPLIEPILPA